MKIVTAFRNFIDALQAECCVSEPIIDIELRKDVFNMLVQECNSMIGEKFYVDDFSDGDGMKLWGIEILKERE